MRSNLITGILTLCGCALFMIISNPNASFALEFSDYTSVRYKIEFQYPSSWVVMEREDGLKIDDPLDTGFFLITYSEDLRLDFGTPDLIAAVSEAFDFIENYPSQDRQVISNLTFITIDGEMAGTFESTFKDKNDYNAWRWVSQDWFVFVRDRGYIISFSDRAGIYHSLENIDIRDQLIKSINFLG